MRTVVYARYSTDLQSASSIDDQVRICRERVDREGWIYQHAYEDRAASGASRLRSAYQQLLEDARRGQFDIVVAESLDRLSRDQEDVAHLYKQLSFAGVKLMTLSEGWISELHIGFSGTMGALFHKQLAKKTHRGLRGRVEAGRSGGGNSYGYEVINQPKANGVVEHRWRSINELQAATVRRIFLEYCNGTSPRAIAKSLNGERLLAPSGGSWLIFRSVRRASSRRR